MVTVSHYSIAEYFTTSTAEYSTPSMRAPAVVSLLLCLCAASAGPCPAPPPDPHEYPLCNATFPGYVDIRSIPADLVVPNTTASFCEPAPGIRVLVELPGTAAAAAAPPPPGECSCVAPHNSSAAFFMLYLPTDYDAARFRSYPIIIELAGNGPYISPFGDVSNGRVDDTYLGFGITQGQGAIWASVPFLTANGYYGQTYWWGCDLPADPQPCGNGTGGGGENGCVSSGQPPMWMPPSAGCDNSTDTTAARAYLRAVVAYLLSAFHGDAARVVVAGFSRGAIGVNYIGLGDDETAALWAGSIAYAHYDGQPEDLRWPYPENTPAAAYNRLQRLGARPQFICSELNSTLSQTKPFIEAAGFPVNATYVPTGYCNHNSEWVLRPSTARDALRQWWARIVD